MRILILTVIMALPLMAFGQKEEQKGEPQPPPAQTNEAPGTDEKAAPAKPQTKPERAADERKQADVKARTEDINRSKTETRAESSRDERGQADVKGHARGVNKTEAETRSDKSTSRTKVNVQEFRSRHSEVFALGRHPKDFFIQRYGEKHFREIGNTYFVFVDGCWVAVDVDGFTYTQRVICEGDPDYIAIVD